MKQKKIFKKLDNLILNIQNLMKKSSIKYLITIFVLIYNFPVYGITSDWKTSNVGEDRILQMRLTSSTDGVVGLKKVPISFEVITNSGWKIYWRNPGDSGLPTEIKFDNSSNVRKVDIFWPLPFRFSTFGIDTFGYEGHVILPIDITPKLKDENISLNAQVSLLACKDICIPFTENLYLEIPKSPHQPNKNARSRAQFMSLVPKLDNVNNGLLGEVYLTEDGILLKNPKIKMVNSDIFVENEYGINFGKPELKGKNILLPKLNDNLREIKNTLFKFTYVSNELSFQNNVTLNKNFSNNGLNLFYEIVFFIMISFVGGFILNFMPCVLPVISLKLASIINENSFEVKKVRKSFLFTSIGIISSFLLLALTLISLKHLGHSISWGIQFQNSYFLILISSIIFAFGLNMLGVFEINLPNNISKLFSKKYRGNFDDFLRGFLTTLLATPCSAPFVGTAITYAFSENYLNMLIIFLFMSLGLSFPWISIAIFPASLSYLPSPGRWMVQFKYLLGAGLILTAIWIFSIFLTSINYNFLVSRQIIDNEFIISWQKGYAEELAKKGEIVLVDITADWCLTCKLNKFTIFNDNYLEQEIKKGNIKFVQGDWTLPDQDILEFLGENKKYGIPFNIIYGPKYTQGIILPEILTIKSIMKAIEKVQ